MTAEACCEHTLMWHHEERGCGYHGYNPAQRCPCLLLFDEALDHHDAAVRAAERDRVLTEVADAWQQGEWANAPRRADRVEERIASAQYVTDWLRALASASGTPEEGK